MPEQTNTRCDKRTNGIRRYFITSHRTSSVHVIPFDHLIRAEHVVRIADLSVVGVGVESSEMIEPGLVCFEEPVSGQKFGVITWCKQHRQGYRAGISFVTIAHDQAEYILYQLKHNSSHNSLRDPERIIETLLKSLKNGNGA